jgi:hypothetical protein
MKTITVDDEIISFRSDQMSLCWSRDHDGQVYLWIKGAAYLWLD